MTDPSFSLGYSAAFSWSVVATQVARLIKFLDPDGNARVHKKEVLTKMFAPSLGSPLSVPEQRLRVGCQWCF